MQVSSTSASNEGAASVGRGGVDDFSVKVEWDEEMEDRVSRENGVVGSPRSLPRRVTSNSVTSGTSLIAPTPEMSQRIRWSDRAECYLIDFYRENEVLWEPKHEHYYKRDVRDGLLAKLCSTWDDEFGFTVTIRDVKEKIKNLRTTYLRELKKARESRKAGHPHPYRPRWIHYNALEFLKDVMVKGEDGTEPADITMQDYLQESNDRTDRLSDEESAEENKVEVSTAFPPIVQIMEETNYTPQPKKPREEETPQPPPVRVVNFTDSTPKIFLTTNGVIEEDPETLFSRYIAASLRRLSRLSCERAKLDIQHVILKYTEESL